MSWNSKAKIFGKPVISIGANAKGIIAIGFIARGFIAFGFTGYGFITIAQFGAGIIAITQFGIGLISISQFSLGMIALGQFAFGSILAVGMMAVGFASIGGGLGYYTVNNPKSVHDAWDSLCFLIKSDPNPFIIWTFINLIVFFFFYIQKSKFTGKWKIYDFFRPGYKHSDAGYRKKSILKISDDNLLKKIVLKDPYIDNKKTAIDKIDNQKILSSLAQNKYITELHNKIIKKIDDERLLYEIALNSETPYMAHDVILRIRNQHLLHDISHKAKIPAFRGAAMSLLDNPDDSYLLERVLRETDEGVLIPIVKRAKIQETLIHAIKRSASAKVKLLAIDKLKMNAQRIIADLLLVEKNQEAASALAELITNQNLLKEVSRRANSINSRVSAIYAMKKPGDSFLVNLVNNEKNLSVCKAALLKITDKNILMDIAIKASRLALAILAVKVIDNRNLIKKIINKTKNEKVKKTAEERLELVLPFYFSFKIELKCPFCSQPVFINGLLTKIKCNSCISIIDLNNEFWIKVLRSDYGRSRYLNYNDLIVEKRQSSPHCQKCGEKLEADFVPTGKDGFIKCSKCGDNNKTFPLPADFRWVTNAEQIFCGELENEDLPSESKDKTIAIACIRCGAPLSIDNETPRNVKCSYCDTVQYLPDTLWISLHPAKIKRIWYLRLNWKKEKY